MSKKSKPAEFSSAQREQLLHVLQTRFEQNLRRHPGIIWTEVRARLTAHVGKLWSLHEMERTGGEPDVVERDSATGEYLFFDCSAESPPGRRGVCYDLEALDSRKEHKPDDSAVELAAALGIDLLTEEEYLSLQKLGEFDTKSSSWIKTPSAIRNLGGALFADHRYGRVFVYQSSAPCYYRVRGFRGSLRV